MLVIGVLFDLLLLLCDFCSRRSYILMILMTIPSIIIGNAFARMLCIICGFLFWNILLLCLKGLFLSECSILVRIIDYWSVTCSSICNTFFVPLLPLFLPLLFPFPALSLFFFHLAYICRILSRGAKVQNPKSLIGRVLRPWLLQHRATANFCSKPAELYSPNSGPSQVR